MSPTLSAVQIGDKAILSEKNKVDTVMTVQFRPNLSYHNQNTKQLLNFKTSFLDFKPASQSRIQLLKFEICFLKLNLESQNGRINMD